MPDFRSRYAAGDIVVFKSGDYMLVGMVVGVSFNINNEIPIWYSIMLSKTTTYNASNNGEIAEENIIGRVSDDALRTAVLKSVIGERNDKADK